MTPPKNDTAIELAFFKGHTEATLDSIAEALNEMREVHAEIFARFNALPCKEEAVLEERITTLSRWIGALWGLFITGAGIALAWAWKQK